MAEKYKGVKFETIFLNKEVVKNENINVLIKWCNKIDELGLAPKHDSGSAGNLSVRTENGFIITGSGTDFEIIKEEEFVEVLECDKEKKEIKCNGIVNPSSEAIIHYSIYEKRNEVNAIFHAHDDLVMKKLNEVTTTFERPYGTLELVDEVMNVLDNHDYIVMRNHGIIALGKAMEEAGKLIVKKNEEAKKLT